MKAKYYAVGAFVEFGWICVVSVATVIIAFIYPGLQVSDYPSTVIVCGVVIFAGIFIIGRRYRKWAEWK